jgi:enoyl-CoA hydratase
LPLLERPEATAVETGFIGYEVDGRIATITLDRPEAANAHTLPMLDDLDEVCRCN